MATLTLVPAVEGHTTLAEARRNVLLTPAVDRLIARAAAHPSLLAGIRVSVISSTASGGGVSEMLHSLMAMQAELRICSQWLVLTVPPADAPPFFMLTKALHNALHSSPHTPTLEVSAEQAAAFARVGEACARDLLARWLPPCEGVSEEIVMLHDPQPLAMALHLRAALPRAMILWRCHIGSGKEATPASRAAWGFLAPFLQPFDASIYSLKAYFPAPGICPAAQPFYVIPPGINPCSCKNKVLSFYECSSLLTRAGLLPPPPEVQAAGERCTGPEPFAPGAKIYVGGGRWQDAPAAAAAAATTTTGAPPSAPPRVSVPFLTRPLVTQVSRWDRLKGWQGLISGFAHLKSVAGRALWEGPDAQNVCESALCLAGPDPGGVSDDVEGAAVLLETCAQWDALPPEVQRDVYLVLLPMEHLGDNALMVVRFAWPMWRPCPPSPPPPAHPHRNPFHCRTPSRPRPLPLCRTAWRRALGSRCWRRSTSACP